MENQVETLARHAYREAGERMRNPALASVVRGGLTILYGPPPKRTDVVLISFQGGGAAPVVYDHWPTELLYLDDEQKSGNAFKFGRNLCTYARSVGLYETISQHSLVVSAVFPGAPASEASTWLSQSAGPKSDWRRFSISWIERFVDAARPAVIVVFGRNTSKALGIDQTWQGAEYNHRQGSMTFGSTKYRGTPTVFCGHLSRGYVAREVLRSLRYAREIIRKDGRAR